MGRSSIKDCTFGDKQCEHYRVDTLCWEKGGLVVERGKENVICHA